MINNWDTSGASIQGQNKHSDSPLSSKKKNSLFYTHQNVTCPHLHSCYFLLFPSSITFNPLTSLHRSLAG